VAYSSGELADSTTVTVATLTGAGKEVCYCRWHGVYLDFEDQ